ncbi:hypothetical protein ITI46_30100 [Streptomyces oryzae]|uniref:Uncharacterized protein n=1 Tax=Streptomyces oryzae TaxID=1434886 RepID=A0ABS3XKD6_9ACTN|nr:hypothetical protein [Streptomyces oryzae]MBO8195869.1 hypothetical protein [Streptomyces oryzae]
MWSVGQTARDAKTGRNGEIIQISGPPPFIYWLELEKPRTVVHRYSTQLRPALTRAHRGA